MIDDPYLAQLFGVGGHSGQDRGGVSITVAEVIDDVDETLQGRVQISLPFAPHICPWARVVAPWVRGNGAAGPTGLCAMPRVGDEVLVAFDRGDLRDPYVLGGLYGSVSRPPISEPREVSTKVVLRTDEHEIVLDDAARTMTIRTGNGARVELGPAGVEVAGAKGGPTIAIDTEGNIKIGDTKTASLTLEATRISIEATTLELKGTAKATLNGGSLATVEAATVKLN